LVPNDSFSGFRHREIRQWDEQAAAYDEERLTDPIYQAGIASASAALRPRPGELILDAGSGTGLTLRQYYRPGMRVVALDLSLVSLHYLKKDCRGCVVYPVRGDLTSLPFATGVFDRVLCANALQHIPGLELRQRCIQELARVVRPKGTVVVTTHNFSLPKQRAGWRKEGSARGPSGDVQYIYRHEAAEFHTLLASAMCVDRVRGAGLPLWYRWKLSGLSRLLERWLLARLPVSAHWGHMLVGTGRKAG
jgi:SAM-dependent methyltransferase